MSAIVNYDLLVDQYCDYSQSFTYSQGPTAETATPVNLTGYTAFLMFRLTPTDFTPLLSISTTPNASGSIVIQVPVGGTVPNQIVNFVAHTALSATGIFTAGLQAYYDLLLTSPVAIVTKFATGRVVVGGTYTH